MKREHPSRGIRRSLGSDSQDSSSGRARSAPAVLVVFELESNPRVVACWDTDEDDARMTAWLDAHPEHAEILHWAVELSLAHVAEDEVQTWLEDQDAA